MFSLFGQEMNFGSSMLPRPITSPRTCWPGGWGGVLLPPSPVRRQFSFAFWKPSYKRTSSPELLLCTLARRENLRREEQTQQEAAEYPWAGPHYLQKPPPNSAPKSQHPSYTPGQEHRAEGWPVSLCSRLNGRCDSGIPYQSVSSVPGYSISHPGPS